MIWPGLISTVDPWTKLSTGVALVIFRFLFFLLTCVWQLTTSSLWNCNSLATTGSCGEINEGICPAGGHDFDLDACNVFCLFWWLFSLLMTSTCEALCDLVLVASASLITDTCDWAELRSSDEIWNTCTATSSLLFRISPFSLSPSELDWANSTMILMASDGTSAEFPLTSILMCSCMYHNKAYNRRQCTGLKTIKRARGIARGVVLYCPSLPPPSLFKICEIIVPNNQHAINLFQS